ncbi:hypothetical protein GQ53DRAFT_744619 [Thozetella sp. PMI_491]|nr:hypothetical protein GQ53DRAFT_744619 [Thozetella sp. PMI_491]
MSFERPLRGGCHCGRNRYTVEFPKETTESVKLVFSPQRSHRVSQGSPIPAFLRVPLEWYHSATVAFFPDETSSMIHKVYTAPYEQHTKRHFCGFCGTSLTYWSEQPQSEANFIQLTLGTLSTEDLHDLEELGLLPDEDDGAVEAPGTPEEAKMTGTDENVIIYTGRETLGGLPWLDTLMEGSKLGTLRASKGTNQSRDGRVRVEWEVVEWTEDDGGDEGRPGKRKLGDLDEGNPASAMEGIQQ